MTVKIPEFVMTWIQNQAKEQNNVKIDIEIYHDPAMTILRNRHGLTFNWELKWYGLDGFSINIQDYLIGILKYNRKYIKIRLNNTLLDEIKEPVILPQQIPPEIDLSQTQD